jgi:diguanylate cyclase (GGDEF)-like protein/PAS domain S-box-containing protein
MQTLGNLRISTKVLLAPAAVMLALGITAWVALSATRTQEIALLHLQKEVQLPMQRVADLRNATASFQTRAYALISFSANETDTSKLADEARSLLKRIPSLNAAATTLQTQLNSLPEHQDNHAMFDALASYSASAGDTVEMLLAMPSYSALMMNDTERRFNILRNEIDLLISRLEARRVETVDAFVASTAHARNVLIITFIVTGTLSGLAALAIKMMIVRPIVRLTKAMRRLSGGDMAVDVTAISHHKDEVGEMAATVQVFKDGLLEAKRLTIERETARSREAARLRKFANGTFEGILVSRDSMVLEANEALCRLLGYKDTAALHDCKLQNLLPIETARAFGVLHPEAPALSAEIEAYRADGSTIPVEVLARVIDYDGDNAVIVAMRDLTERKEAARRIHYLAYHDSLTDLPNRSLFADRLAQSLDAAYRSNKCVAVLSLDLDRFKAVNDILGHEGGDMLLQGVAGRLRAAVRPGDTVARFGGDEFAVLVPLEGSGEMAKNIAQRIIDDIMIPFDVKGRKVEVGISAGIAIYPNDGESGTELLRNSDMALYRAKKEGRGRYQFFEQGMDRKIQARRAIEDDLRHALPRNELALTFQPIYDCGTGQITCLEALMMWHHPTRGPVAATKFISVAEETGLIPSMGLWALKTACAEALNWKNQYAVSVNVSPKQISQSDLAQTIIDLLDRTGFPPERLDLEVTESLLIGDADKALKFMTQMRSKGIAISLDSFGTGYSSLSYLRRFPFSKLKIDKSFVQNLERATEDQEIVRAILALSRSLHLQVTAEGVETEAQLEFLQREGCDRVQGFLLSLAVPASKVNHLPRSFDHQHQVLGNLIQNPVPIRA